ncbi:MAG: ribosome biogenesis GTPase Der [Myxococcota bacterium]
MAKPVIAIVGRPNVGKSTLFNRLVGRREAIVEDQPGVTRDRHYGDGEVLGRRFIVIDTGGFEPEADEGMLPAMRRQAEIAIAEADVVIAMYDGREGLLPTDREVARVLGRADKPVFHAVNKIDGARHEALVAEFWEMGVDSLHSMSAQHGPGVYDLMAEVLEVLPEEDAAAERRAAEATRVAVIGKPNVGKSTLINRLLGEERLLVSDVPGTTVDSIDTWLQRPPDRRALATAETRLEEARAALEAARAREGRGGIGPGGAPSPAGPPDEQDDGVIVHWAGGDQAEWQEDAEGFEVDPTVQDIDIEDARWQAPGDLEAAEEAVAAAETELEAARRAQRYLLIDTAGIRRRKWMRTDLERRSVVRSFKAIDRAEVCLLLVDATVGVTEQDAKLAGMIQDKGRACVILVNKWDAVSDKDTYTAGRYVKELREALKFVSYAPIVFISALSGQRVHRILGAVDRVKVNYTRRIATGPLNRWLAATVRHHQPPVHRGRRLRVYYASQVTTAPPTVLLSVNEPKLLHFSYKRFLVNQLRQQYDFEGTPLRLVVRGRGRKRRG